MFAVIGLVGLSALAIYQTYSLNAVIRNQCYLLNAIGYECLTADEVSYLHSCIDVPRRYDAERFSYLSTKVSAYLLKDKENKDQPSNGPK